MYANNQITELLVAQKLIHTSFVRRSETVNATVHVLGSIFFGKYIG